MGVDYNKMDSYKICRSESGYKNTLTKQKDLQNSILVQILNKLSMIKEMQHKVFIIYVYIVYTHTHKPI